MRMRLVYHVEFHTRNAMGGRKYQGAAGFEPNMPAEVRKAIKEAEWTATAMAVTERDRVRLAALGR